MTLLLSQAGEREGYGGHNWNAGQACVGRGQHDIATACGTLRVLLGKLSLDLGTVAVAGCTGSRGCVVGSNLCLHTGILVEAAAALAFHAHLWGPSS